MAHEHVVAGIATALQVGALTSDVVAVEARKAAQVDPQPAAAAERPAAPEPRATKPPAVTSLTRRRLASLPADTRPLPSVAAYDRLLRNGPPAAGEKEVPS